MIADALVLLFCLGTLVFFVLPAVITEARDCNRRGRARVMRGASWQARDCCHLTRMDVLDGIRCGCGS